MSYITGGQVVAKALKEQGVTHLFTLCGGHIQSIYDGCLDREIRVVDVRHEQSAAHAADGWARVTGQPGVAAVTAGPGVTDTVTAVANAMRAQVPLVLIGGQGSTIYGPMGGQDRGALQEMNHVELMRSITKWSVTVPETRRIAEYIQSAFRVAVSGVPGPVFLELPINILMDSVDDGDLVTFTGSPTVPATMGDARSVEKAATLIRQAHKPVLIVGSQYRWSRHLEGLVELLTTAALPTYFNGMARGVMQPDTPGVFRRSRSKALQESDLVLIFGTPMDFRLGYGEKIPTGAEVIQVDLDAGEIGRNRMVDVGIAGDMGLVMGQLAKVLGPGRLTWPQWMETVQSLEDAMAAVTNDQAQSNELPINPLRLAAEINRFVDSNTIVIGDGGDFVASASYMLDVHGMGNWMDPGPLGTLGVGTGYAMAAKLARPDHNVILVMGDGTFGFNGMEFEAMVRQGIKVTGIIGNDARWTQIYRFQKQMYGEHRTVATKLVHTRYDKMVEALGGHGEYVETIEELAPALERAMRSPVASLVNVKIGSTDFRDGSISV